jgi:protoheme ferro-lyase
MGRSQVARCIYPRPSSKVLMTALDFSSGRSCVRATCFLVVSLVLSACGIDANESESFQAYIHQDAAIEGKSGVLLTSMGVPETYEFGFFDRYLHHIFDSAFPWYAKWIIMRDAGTVLRDPDNLFASEEFSPQSLMDCYGKTSNVEGIPYTTLQVEWKPPRQEGGDGHFLLDEKNGHVDIIEKVAIKMAALDYGKMPDETMPTRAQQALLDNEVRALLALEFPDTAFETAYALYPESIESAVEKLLAAKVETIVVSDVFPVYSSLEQLDNLFVDIENIVNGRAKVVFAPSIGAYPSFRSAYTQIIIDEVAQLPGDSKNLVVLTRHGMPAMSGESYPLFAPVYSEGLTSEVLLALQGKDVTVVVADTDFATDEDDPEDLRLASAEAVSRGVNEGFDNVIFVFIDFLTENSDSIFASRYETLEHYGFAYESKVPYTDYGKRFRTETTQGNTRIIVAGTPVDEPYRKQLARGIFDSLATVLRGEIWPQLTGSH